MAERRMFAKTIIDSDAFLDTPVTARLLYYDLAMRADDDGFVNSPKKIMRMIGASQDDLSILCMKKFIIPFESGVIVIKHWRIHNYIRKDMYHETKYKEEKELLELDENNAYRLSDNVTNPLQVRDEVVTSPSTQVRLGKDRLGKDRLIIPDDEDEDFDEEIELPYKAIINYLNTVAGTRFRASSKDTRKHINARLAEGFTIDDFRTVIDNKVRDWGKDAKMSKFIRPQTLFGPKFEGYLNEIHLNTSPVSDFEAIYRRETENYQ